MIEETYTAGTSEATIVQRPPYTDPWGTTGTRELNIRVRLGKHMAKAFVFTATVSVNARVCSFKWPRFLFNG